MDKISFDLRTNEPELARVPEGKALPAWELVENGRYRPRRICGSFPGRELG